MPYWGQLFNPSDKVPFWEDRPINFSSSIWIIAAKIEEKSNIFLSDRMGGWKQKTVRVTEDWYLTHISNQSTDHMRTLQLSIICENSQGDRGLVPHTYLQPINRSHENTTAVNHLWKQSGWQRTGCPHISPTNQQITWEHYSSQSSVKTVRMTEDWNPTSISNQSTGHMITLQLSIICENCWKLYMTMPTFMVVVGLSNFMLLLLRFPQQNSVQKLTLPHQ